MLNRWMQLPGDSFEERWSVLEHRVRDYCEDAEAPYPERTLQAAKPWLRTIGAWFDWAGPLMGEFIGRPGEDSIQRVPKEHEPGGRQGVPGELGFLIPRSTGEGPVPRLLREVDHLMSRHAEDRSPDQPRLPGERRHLVSVIKHVNSSLLRVGGPPPKKLRRVSVLIAGSPLRRVVFWDTDGSGAYGGDEAYHPLFRKQAVFAVAEYLARTGDVMPDKQRSRAWEALLDRREESNEETVDVLAGAVRTAVPLAYDRMREDLEIEVSGLADGPLLSVREDPDPTGVPVTAPPSAVEILKDRALGRLLTANLLPGVGASLLREQLQAAVREDLVPPIDRDGAERQHLTAQESKRLKAEVIEAARRELGRTISDEREVLARRYVEKLLSSEALSDQQHRVCRLFYEDGLTRDEIADRLDVSPSTVRTHFRRAGEKFRQSTG